MRAHPSGWVRHAPDEGRGVGDEPRLCEAVRPQRIDHSRDGVARARGARRLVKEKEPPLVIECPPDPSELFGGSRRPEDVDVDGEGLVDPAPYRRRRPID